jgi:hypothetical protein
VRTERDILGFIASRIAEHERYLKMNQQEIGKAIVNREEPRESLIEASREIQYAIKELRYVANCEWPADFAPLAEVTA